MGYYYGEGQAQVAARKPNITKDNILTTLHFLFDSQSKKVDLEAMDPPWDEILESYEEWDDLETDLDEAISVLSDGTLRISGNTDECFHPNYVEAFGIIIGDIFGMETIIYSYWWDEKGGSGSHTRLINVNTGEVTEIGLPKTPHRFLTRKTPKSVA